MGTIRAVPPNSAVAKRIRKALVCDWMFVAVRKPPVEVWGLVLRFGLRRVLLYAREWMG